MCLGRVWQACGGGSLGGTDGHPILRGGARAEHPISAAAHLRGHLLYTPQGLLISRRARSIIYPEAIPGGATEALLHGRIYISQGCPVHRFDRLVPSGTCTAHILAGRGTLVVGI